MKRRRITASRTTPAEPEASLALSLLDRIVLAGPLPVYSAWLAMLSTPVAVLFDHPSIKEITVTALFGAVIGAVLAAVLHGVIRACWWLQKLSTAMLSVPRYFPFFLQARKSTLNEARVSV